MALFLLGCRIRPAMTELARLGTRECAWLGQSHVYCFRTLGWWIEDS
jgi:hypothetical protein